jgi:hypothetical protein
MNQMSILSLFLSSIEELDVVVGKVVPYVCVRVVAGNAVVRGEKERVLSGIRGVIL